MLADITFFETSLGKVKRALNEARAAGFLGKSDSLDCSETL